MRGFSSSLETKQDYMNSLELYPDETMDALRSLLNTRYVFVKDKEIESEDKGIKDETHGVISETEQLENGEQGSTKWYQTIRQEDPNARIFRLSFTVAEVEGLVK